MSIQLFPGDQVPPVVITGLFPVTVSAGGQISVAVFGASGASHSSGLAPDPGAVAGTTKFLCENSTWVLPTGLTNAQLAQMPAQTVKANITVGTAAPADVTAATFTSLFLPIFGPSGASHSKGVVPDPGSVAGTVKFLREDATWAVPASSGVSSVTASAPLASSGGANPNISLGASGVGAGTYGSATLTPVVTVAATGLITAASNVLTKVLTLFQSITDASTSGVGATDLYSYTIAANQLANNGDSLRISWGLVDTAGGNRSIVATFAGNNLANNVTVPGTNICDFWYDVVLTRTGTATARTMGIVIANDQTLASNNQFQVASKAITGLDFTVSNVLKITGTALTSGTITAKQGLVQFLPAA